MTDSNSISENTYSSKLALTLQNYVFSLLSTENWHLVQFEDEGQLYSVLPLQKVHHISPDRRPDWDSRSGCSRFDVTALTLRRFPMRGREPLESRF